MEHRILIIGSPGSGKSTLAMRLQQNYKIPLYHIDKIQWINDQATVTPESLHAQLKEIVVTPSWIIDGHYSNTLLMRLERATTVIWIKESRWKCIYRVIKRYLMTVFRKPTVGGNPKTISLAFLKYVWDFPENNYDKVDAYYQQTQHHTQWVIGNTQSIYSKLNL